MTTTISGPISRWVPGPSHRSSWAMEFRRQPSHEGRQFPPPQAMQPAGTRATPTSRAAGSVPRRGAMEQPAEEDTRRPQRARHSRVGPRHLGACDESTWKMKNDDPKTVTTKPENQPIAGKPAPISSPTPNSRATQTQILSGCSIILLSHMAHNFDNAGTRRVRHSSPHFPVRFYLRGARRRGVRTGSGAMVIMVCPDSATRPVAVTARARSR